MKDTRVNELIEKLQSEMFSWWKKHRRSAGFKYTHEQALYDALNQYIASERIGAKVKEVKRDEML